MCLGVPGKIISLDDDWTAEVEIAGVTKKIGIQMVPDVAVGDYVLVHTGFAMQRMDEAEALETLKLLEEMVDLADGQVS
ncbi:MAG: HypC/HybG/HupF family hydrogenase formation chaperone [Actinomycetota bacterium]